MSLIYAFLVYYYNFTNCIYDEYDEYDIDDDLYGFVRTLSRGFKLV